MLIKEKHMSQLAHYMATTVLVEYGKPKASVGVLIDKDSLCLAFSVTSVQVGQETIPLPVVLFSPQLKWRKGLAVQKPVVIALCLLCLYQETQLIQTPPVWKKAFGDDEWAKLGCRRPSREKCPSYVGQTTRDYRCLSTGRSSHH